ncbi:MAG: DUF2062 domain-containing protein [Ekhidna sp.]
MIKQRLTNFWLKLKRNFIKVMVSKSSDHNIAISMAIGSFIAVFPTPGVSVFITLFIAAIFKSLDRIALALSQAIWNAFTVIPIYWLSLRAGKIIFPSETIQEFQWEWLTLFVDFVKRLVVGNLFVSIPLAILTYYITRFGLIQLKKYRNNKFKAKIKRRKELRRKRAEQLEIVGSN